MVLRADCHGAELALWRSAGGRVNAWRDRCQHRGMRLSHGFVRGETLSCIYHGWVYGTDGGCTRIPAHPALVPPAAIRADAFRCAEASGAVWVAAADATGGPPDLGPRIPVRSIHIAAAGVELPGFVAQDGVWHGRAGGHGLVLAIQPVRTIVGGAQGGALISVLGGTGKVQLVTGLLAAIGIALV